MREEREERVGEVEDRKESCRKKRIKEKKGRERKNLMTRSLSPSYCRARDIGGRFRLGKSSLSLNASFLCRIKTKKEAKITWDSGALSQQDKMLPLCHIVECVTLMANQSRKEQPNMMLLLSINAHSEEQIFGCSFPKEAQTSLPLSQSVLLTSIAGARHRKKNRRRRKEGEKKNLKKKLKNRT